MRVLGKTLAVALALCTVAMCAPAGVAKQICHPVPGTVALSYCLGTEFGRDWSEEDEPCEENAGEKPSEEHRCYDMGAGADVYSDLDVWVELTTTGTFGSGGYPFADFCYDEVDIPLTCETGASGMFWGVPGAPCAKSTSKSVSSLWGMLAINDESMQCGAEHDPVPVVIGGSESVVEVGGACAPWTTAAHSYGSETWQIAEWGRPDCAGVDGVGEVANLCIIAKTATSNELALACNLPSFPSGGCSNWSPPPITFDSSTVCDELVLLPHVDCTSTLNALPGCDEASGDCGVDGLSLLGLVIACDGVSTEMFDVNLPSDCSWIGSYVGDGFECDL